MVTPVRVHPEVEEAHQARQPVVALETTIFSHLGLPAPQIAGSLVAQ